MQAQQHYRKAQAEHNEAVAELDRLKRNRNSLPEQFGIGFSVALDMLKPALIMASVTPILGFRVSKD